MILNPDVQPTPEDPQILQLFIRLIDEEATRLGCTKEIDAQRLGEGCYETFEEVLRQHAYEAIKDMLDARESLPPWICPTGDAPTPESLIGTTI